MMQKEIKVSKLFESELCIKEILYNEWPEKSFENEKCLVPYNQSKLCLQYNYPMIFRSQWEIEEKERQDIIKGTFEMKPGAKTAKLKFEVNMLP